MSDKQFLMRIEKTCMWVFIGDRCEVKFLRVYCSIETLHIL